MTDTINITENELRHQTMFFFRMLKWLKDRQLGNTVNKEAVYEHIPVDTKFNYRSTINYDSNNSAENYQSGTGLAFSNLKWTRDGCSLATIVTEWVNSESQIITFLDPNTDVGHLVKSNIDLEYSHGKYFFNLIDFQGTTAILPGIKETPDSDRGCIGLLSLSKGKLEEVIRNGFRQ